MAVTCEHVDSALSPTHHQLMGGCRELGEPSKYNPCIPGPMTLEDPWAGDTSPEAALMPHITKSCYKLPMLLPSRGLASAISMPSAPCGAPPAPTTSVGNATTGCRRVTGTIEARLLSPRHKFLNSGQKQDKREQHKLTINTICISGGHR
jgi:hypothetical protein